MKYVIGVDLGTSAVKLLLVNQEGDVCLEVSKSYPLIQGKSGYSEQDPEQWVEKMEEGLAELVQKFPGNVNDIEGMSFSGQMHGLVLMDEKHRVLRNAILWNDTRTTKQCREIEEIVGKEQLLQITKNHVLEGFTLPKLLWVKQNEPYIFESTAVFMLPKDYLRYCLTGKIHSEYSDAAGTLLLDMNEKKWSHCIGELMGINMAICPPLVESHEYIGTITDNVSKRTGLSGKTKVFAGGADNACGAIGAGVLSEGKSLCSIGTSGVVLSYEKQKNQDYGGKVHYFNHGEENTYYTMGVTLSAGHSLSWFRSTFAPDEPFEDLMEKIENVPAGSNGLLFTPYLSGERTPHADSVIRGSFIGVHSRHSKKEFLRSVVEGITFSLNESIQIFRENGKKIDTIVSIGGGAKSSIWLQIQADVFRAKVVKLKNEQGPGMGAAMLAAYGSGWFSSLQECADTFLDIQEVYNPQKEQSDRYAAIFEVYKTVYEKTKQINEDMKAFRQ
ncbi:xylulokinase [Peribacillus sp. NPDC097895]|uniref:xylulokinase n=1 Tax=Peribacillus sp. NPDC097895 TaxID=3390619 RepID=UPI003CFDBE1D